MTLYSYHDQAGYLSYQIVRTDLPQGGKTFRQRRPGAVGQWINNLDGLEPIPFHLPRVRSTIQKGGLVIIVEGEKAAERLNNALVTSGLKAIATCNNGGAGHWKDKQSRWLKDANVLMLPDNDEPGRNHVEVAGRYLKAAGVKSLRCIELPGLPEKGDIVDWLEAGHTLDELRVLYSRAPEYEPPSDQKEKKVAPPRVIVPHPDSAYSAWAQAALDGEIGKLAKLNDGRFHQLKSSANRLGTIAAHGWLTENECVTGLMSALETNGYTQKPGKNYHTAEHEVRFYFKSGLNFPCEIPARYEKETREDQPMSISEKDADQKNQGGAFFWDQGVPIEIRGIVNRYTHPSVGPIMELITEGINARLLKPDYLTVKLLKNASDKLDRGLSETAIRRGLKQSADPHGVGFLSVIDHYSFIKDGESPPICKKLVGRDSEVYAVRPLAEFLAGLIDFIDAPLIERFFPVKDGLLGPMRPEFLVDMLQDEEAQLKTDELMARYGDQIEAQEGFANTWSALHRKRWKLTKNLQKPTFAPMEPNVPYGNTTLYRTECARAILKARGGKAQIARADWCDYLGCSDGMLPTVFRRAHIEVDKGQYLDEPLTDANLLKQVKGRYDASKGGVPMGVLSSLSKALYPIKKEGLIPWALSQLKKGAKLVLRYHQANLYCFKRLTRWMMACVRVTLKVLLTFFGYSPEPEQQSFLEEEQEPIELPALEPIKVHVKRVPVPKISYGEALVCAMANKFTDMRIDLKALPADLVRPAVQISLDALLTHERKPDMNPDADCPEADLTPLLSTAGVEHCTDVMGGEVAKVEYPPTVTISLLDLLEKPEAQQLSADLLAAGYTVRPS